MTPFNIGQRIELHDFSEAEAQVLAFGLGAGDQEGAAFLRRILYWTGGHPYLTQRLCQAVSESNPQSPIRDPQSVDRLCGELFFASRAREQDDNLLFVRERMLRSEVELAGLLSLYDQVHRRKRVEDDETNPLISVLGLSGIMRAEGGRLLVRNRIYERVFDREWIAQNMPDAEVRRQRAAYRKGLMRATAVAALILVVIGALSFAAVRGRQQAVKQQQLAEQEREKAEQQRTRAEEEAQRADRNARELEKALVEANRERQQAQNQQAIAEQQRGLAEEQRDRAEQQEKENRRLLYAAQMNLAGQAWEDAGIPRMTELLNNQVPKRGQEDLRGFEWNYLWNLGNSELRSFRHGNRITSVSFFPDSARLVTTGDDSVVRIWDVVTGQQLMTLSGHSDKVWVAAVSPDGKIVASGSDDQTVKLWDAFTGQEISTLKGHTNWIDSLSFSPDGMKLATASRDKSVRLWDLIARREIATFIHPDIVTYVAFSPDGKTLATACNDRNARLWDAISGKELHTLRGHIAAVSTLAFSPDGATLITGGGVPEADIRFWDVASGTSIMLSSAPGNQQPVPRMIRSSGGIMSVSFSSDGQTIAVANYDRRIRLYSTAKLQLVKIFKGHGLSADRLAFAPNGKLLATGGREGVVKLWDPAVDQEQVIEAAGLYVNNLAFSPDGCCLAIAGRSTAAELWDISARKKMQSFTGHTDGILDVAFFPDGRRIVTASRDRTARLWDVGTGKELRSFKGHTDFVECVAVSSDGGRLATGSNDKTVKIWDVLNGQELGSLSGHAGDVISVAFSRDGKHLATAGLDSTVRLWDAVTFRETASFKHLEPVYHLAFSPDGKSLATACGDGLVRVWDLATGKESLTLRGHHSPPSRLAFFPDGKRLATGSGDNTVKLWNLETRQEMLSVRHNSRINALAVSPDGRKLASAASNQVKVWQTSDQASADNTKLERLRELTSVRKAPEPEIKYSLPPSWSVDGDARDRYEIGVDHSTRYSGTASAFIRATQPSPTGFAGITQGIGVAAYRGRRVRLSAYVKAERVNGHAGLWMRVDGAGYALNFDNMSSRSINGTADWKRYQVVLDIPEESFALFFGVLLHGDGQVWADDFDLEIVGPDVPSTGRVGYGVSKRDEFMRLPERERQLTEQIVMTRVYNLRAKPVNMDFEGSN